MAALDVLITSQKEIDMAIAGGLLTLLFASAVALSAAGCGGGPDGTGLPAPAPAPSPTPACAGPNLEDAWLTARTGCIAAGDQFISLAAGHGSTASDVAFIVKEQINYDGFTAITQARHFKRLLCLKNAPEIAGFGSYAAALAADLAGAMKASNQYIGIALPGRVSAVAISLSGTNQPSPLATICDPAVHLVIVDYATGKVLSVNPGAVIEVYETPN